MDKQISLTIDGRQVTVPAGLNIVDAAKQAGVDIPVFCHHPKLEPVGMCRMCLVEIGRPVRDRATGQFVV
ncbi:MAG TPA: 2Fe-2S iron-sulfur cluster-binding protein, partial [Anaerolineales bacterium]|nr:2Fe-2S iron-sulfur cluster-binding protein [Anaerolineales bacterium]